MGSPYFEAYTVHDNFQLIVYSRHLSGIVVWHSVRNCIPSILLRRMLVEGRGNYMI
jgi:hypothetical protein